MITALAEIGGPATYSHRSAALNDNPEQNTSWSSGASFLRPLSIVPPRLARLDVKLEW